MKILKPLFTKFSLFIVILLALFAYRNLFHVGLLPTHDGEYHILRFYEFDKAIHSGNLYPRWANDFNFGYGVPLFNFVYPFPNFVASVIHLFGPEFIDIFKIQMAIAAIVGGVSMYLWSKELWGKLGGVTSAILYMYAPYMFLDIFIRGSVGEVWALGLFPLFLWAITRYIRNEKNIFSICCILLALVIVSHNILALMFFIFAFLYVGVLLLAEGKLDKKTLSSVATIYILALSLSAIFWLPALVEKQYVVGLDIFDIKSNFPDLFQLIVPSWGSGFSGGDLQNQMSFQIGLINIFVVVVAFIVLMWLYKKKMKEQIILVSFFIVSFFIVVLFMLPSSLLIWEHVPLMTYFQFPWRFLSLEILICAILGGSFLHAFSNKYLRYGYVLFICIFSIAFTYSYNVPPFYHIRTDSYYISRSNFIDSTNSPGNAFNTKWMKPATKRRESIIAENKDIKSSVIHNNYTDITYLINVQRKTNIVVNITYFPGWVIRVDEESVPIKITSQGIMEITLTPGKHTVTIIYTQTPIELLSSLISFCSLVFLLTHGTIKQTRIYRKYENRNRH